MSFTTPFAIWLAVTVLLLISWHFAVSKIGKLFARTVTSLYLMIFIVTYFRFGVAYAQAATRDFSRIAQDADVVRIFFEGQGNLMSGVMVVGTILTIAFCEHRLRKVHGT